MLTYGGSDPNGQHATIFIFSNNQRNTEKKKNGVMDLSFRTRADSITGNEAEQNGGRKKFMES